MFNDIFVNQCCGKTPKWRIFSLPEATLKTKRYFLAISQYSYKTILPYGKAQHITFDKMSIHYNEAFQDLRY